MLFLIYTNILYNALKIYTILNKTIKYMKKHRNKSIIFEIFITHKTNYVYLECK